MVLRCDGRMGMGEEAGPLDPLRRAVVRNELDAIQDRVVIVDELRYPFQRMAIAAAI